MARLRAWLQRSANRQIFAAAVTVGGYTFVAKVIAMGKDVAVAYSLGTSDALDAFLIALVVPMVATGVITGALSAAVIPKYIAVRADRGRAASNALIAGTAFWTILLLVLVAILLAATTRFYLPLLGSGYTPAKLALTRFLLLLLLPGLLLSGIASLWTAALNAEGSFAVGAIAPGIVPMSAAAALLLFGNAAGVASLALGNVVGYALQCTWVGVELHRRGIPVKPRLAGMSEDIRAVLRQYLPMAGAAVLMTGTVLVDQAMAARLPSGNVSTLNYGTKIAAVVLNLTSLALGTAVLPHFSEMVALRKWHLIRHTLRTYVKIIVVCSIPATLALIAWSHTLVTFLFQRGAFTARDADSVTLVQQFYVLQIPFFALGILFVRLLAALQQNRIIFWGTMISLPLDVVLNLIFIRYLGVAGIALATACVYVVSATYLGMTLRFALRRFFSAEDVVVASVVA